MDNSFSCFKFAMISCDGADHHGHMPSDDPAADLDLRSLLKFGDIVDSGFRQNSESTAEPRGISWPALSVPILHAFSDNSSCNKKVSFKVTVNIGTSSADPRMNNVFQTSVI